MYATQCGVIPFHRFDSSTECCMIAMYIYLILPEFPIRWRTECHVKSESIGKMWIHLIKYVGRRMTTTTTTIKKMRRACKMWYIYIVHQMFVQSMSVSMVVVALCGSFAAFSSLASHGPLPNCIWCIHMYLYFMEWMSSKGNLHKRTNKRVPQHIADK